MFTDILIFVLTICIQNSLETLKNLRYDGYSVHEVRPMNEKQLKFLKTSRIKKEFEYWLRPTSIEQPVHIVSPPDSQHRMIHFLKNEKMFPKILIQNLKELIDKEAETKQKYIKGRIISMNFKDYFNLEEIYDWLNDMNKKYRENMKITSIGVTHEDRKIKAVNIKYGNPQNVAVIECGSHAREWLSPSFCTYVIKQIMNNRTDTATKKAFRSLEWYVIPVLNPDGYHYSFTEDRFWVKNRQGEGVDINRNFDFKWDKKPSRPDGKHDYQGISPFSEVESRAIRDHLIKINTTRNIMFYISVHTYGQQYLVPYGLSKKHRDEYKQNIYLAELIAQSLNEKFDQLYTFGSVEEKYQIVSGLSLDWVKETFDVPCTFAIIMKDRGNNGFLLRKDEILPNHRENIFALKMMIEVYQNTSVHLHRKRSNSTKIHTVNISKRSNCTILKYIIILTLLFFYV